MRIAYFLVTLLFVSSYGSNPCVVKFDTSSYGIGVLNETFTNASYCAYLGVRYAEPPIGTLRFKDPVLYTPNGPQDYSSVGDKCPQGNSRNYFSETLGNEDCLFMNVYSPSTISSDNQHNSTKYPVLVFVHGGSFAIGSALSDVEHGVDLLIDSGILVISINYRLYALGFLQYPELNITGNFGLKDQRAALQWIQRYIKIFGGDPERVTLMGHSAGAASVTHHLYAESSRGLFRQLFALGGTMIVPYAVVYDQDYSAKRLISRLNISTVEELQEVDFHNFFQDSDSASFGFFTMFHPTFVPTLEDSADTDAFLTIPPYKLVLGKPANQVPVLIEHTATEFELLLKYTDFLFVGSNFPNNKNESLLRDITHLVVHKAISHNDPSFFKKLANMANYYYSTKQLLKHLGQQLDTTPLYYMRFEYDGRFGFYKNEYYKSETNGSRYGAVHGDELGYIFSPYVVQEALQNRNDFRQEWEVHERTVELVTNFVKYGNPTPKPSKHLNIVWPAYNDNLTNPKYLNIDETFEIRTDDDTADEFYMFWESIYQCLYYFECVPVHTAARDLQNVSHVEDSDVRVEDEYSLAIKFK